MESHRFSLKWPRLLAVAMLMVSGVVAQPPATNGWQKIIFSSPDNAQITSNVTSAAQSSLSSLENKLRIYQDSSPVASFANPSLMAAPMPAPIRAVRRPPGENSDWEFMTPEQILGIASPDQIMKSQKRSADPDTASLTSLERAFGMRSPSARFQVAPFSRSHALNSWGGNSDQAGGLMSGLVSDSLKGMQSGLFNPNTSSDSENQNPQSVWGKIFGMPSPAPAQNPVREQQQDMKQFMKLLNRSSALATAETPPLTTSLGLNSDEPLANPIGASFAPLTSGIGKPIGLGPPPAVIRQPSTAVAPPAWAPQPPPWLSPTPQPFAVPQRKF